MVSKWVERVAFVLLLIAVCLIFIPVIFPDFFVLFSNGVDLCYASVAIGFLLFFIAILMTRAWRRDNGVFSFPKIPRGPEDWGELLYEESWGREQRFRSPVAFIILLIMAIIALTLLITAILGGVLSGAMGGNIGQMFLFGIVMGSVSLYGLVQQFRQRPFRIYEAGMTRVAAPREKATWNSDFLIPTDAITSIDFRSSISGYTGLEFRFNVEGGRRERIQVNTDLMEEPDRPLIVLYELMGEKMSADLKMYVSRLKR